MAATKIKREVSWTDGVYLGVGTVRLPDGSRSAPGHFALMGPVGKWVGVDDFAEELK